MPHLDATSDNFIVKEFGSFEYKDLSDELDSITLNLLILKEKLLRYDLKSNAYLLHNLNHIRLSIEQLNSILYIESL